MIKPTILLLFLSLSSLAFSQSACSKYGGDYNQILTALKSKNTSTDRHKLDEGHLESIATYWVAACKCENGVTTEAEAQQLYTTIFDNRIYISDNFTDHGRIIYKDKTPFGDLYPGAKVYTKSSCLKGGSATTISSAFDCVPEAATFSQTAKDPQQFGAAFFRAFCECKNGVNSYDRKYQLQIEMKENHKNYHAYKAPGEPSIMAQPLLQTDCPNATINPGYSDPKESVIVNDEYLNLLNEIAADSKNPNFKTMVEGMNHNKEVVGKGRNFALQSGTMKKGDIDYYNNLENIAQGVEIGKFIFKSLSNKNEVIPLSGSQQEAREIIQNLFTEVSGVYNEVNNVPTFYEFNKNELEKLEEIESRIDLYERSTATKRLMYFEYWNTKPYMTTDEINSRYNAILSQYNTYGSDAIIEQINSKSAPYKKNNFFYPMLNNDVSMISTFAEIDFIKVQCYRSMGMDEEANLIMQNVLTSGDKSQSFIQLHNSYESKNYQDAIQFYTLAKHIIVEQEEKTRYAPYYIGIAGTITKEIITRNNVSYAIGQGIISYVTLGQVTKAYDEFQFLQWFNEGLKYEDFDKLNVNECAIIEQLIESKIQSKMNNESCQASIEEGLQMAEEELLLAKFTPAFKLVELEELIKQNRFIEAKSVARFIHSETNIPLQFGALLPFFEVKDYKFLLSFMKYREGKLQSAISSLTVLEKEYPEMNRTKILKEEIENELKITKNE